MLYLLQHVHTGMEAVVEGVPNIICPAGGRVTTMWQSQHPLPPMGRQDHVGWPRAFVSYMFSCHWAWSSLWNKTDYHLTRWGAIWGYGCGDHILGVDKPAAFSPLMQDEEKKAAPWHAGAVKGKEAELGRRRGVVVRWRVWEVLSHSLCLPEVFLIAFSVSFT